MLLILLSIILAYFTADSFYYFIGTVIIGYLLMSFISYSINNKTIAMSSSSSSSSSAAAAAAASASAASSSSISISNDNHNNDECVMYDSGDVAMLILQLSRDSSNIITLETALIIDIFRFANIAPKRQRMYTSSSLRYKTTYNENALYCSYNICSKTNIFMPTTITITIDSKDQGWSSYPDEHGQRTSHTWGELSLNNMDTRHFLYRNIHAGRNFEKQVIVFDANSPLINEIYELMNTDDCISINLHSRSQYPGWVNYIKEAHFEIQFDINTTEVLNLLGKYLLRK